jgi:enoyl-CoA hydratase
MKIETRDRIALVRMDTGRANAINLSMLEALDGAVDEFEGSDARALVLTGTGKTFCAGLDLRTIAGLDRAGVAAVMDGLHRVFLRIFRLPRPVVAAVNGHAIAGGCVLVQQADFRVMQRGDFRIGLNETQLGVGLPAVVVETLRYHAPASSFVPVALEGRLFDPEEALRLFLLDETAEDAEARALERARARAEVPADAYAQVKASLKAPFVERAEARRAKEAGRWLDTCFGPAARARIAEVVKRLA